MINLNFGFRDLRTLGELAIGAEPPLSRDAAPSPSKFGLPGAATGPDQRIRRRG